MGEELLGKYMGSSMHIFLLDIPRLEFAALIPKGDYLSVCLLGENIDRQLTRSFLDSREVKHSLPPDRSLDLAACQCSPRINIKGAIQPYADRVVFIGDAGVSRLYKDGIGAAFRTAKAAATTVIFEGISASKFSKFYWPTCEAIERDNTIGKMIFAITRQIQKRQFARVAVIKMINHEQNKKGKYRRMSMLLWDLFTGSATYREIFIRAFHPFLFFVFLGKWQKH